MHKILLTGSSGFVGKNMCELLLKESFNVKEISRKSVYKGKIIGDFSKVDNWTNIISDTDIIIHLSAYVHKKDNKFINKYNEDDDLDCKITTKLATAAAKLGIKKFIFLSSIGVNGMFSENKFNSKSELKPFSKYTYSKKNIEKRLLEISSKYKMEIIIIRSPLIYGKSAPGTFSLLHNAIINNYPIPFGRIKNNRRSYISINNLTDFILFVIKKNNPSDGIYLVSDNQDISTFDLVRIMKSKANSDSLIIGFPLFLLMIIFFLIGKKNWIYSTIKSLEIDCEETTNKIGWKPPYKLENEINKIFNSS